MNIETVKIQSGGWLVNGSLSVPNDPSNRYYKEVQTWLETNTPDPEFTQAELDQQKISAIEAALQAELDKEAVSLGYDSINTVVSYADEPAVVQFQTDGQSFRAWRSLVWEYAYTQLAMWQGGGSEPTVDDIIFGMPTRT